MKPSGVVIAVLSAAATILAVVMPLIPTEAEALPGQEVCNYYFVDQAKTKYYGYKCRLCDGSIDTDIDPMDGYPQYFTQKRGEKCGAGASYCRSCANTQCTKHTTSDGQTYNICGDGSYSCSTTWNSSECTQLYGVGDPKWRLYN